MTPAALLRQRAELLRQVAAIDDALARTAEAPAPAAGEPDRVFTLAEAAAYLGEPARTIRERLEYRKAQVSRPGERRLRFSKRALDRVITDRLARNGED